ncbi:MAG: YdeI/OmpD-associated family protein [Saprospiraceae bacterium]
MAKHNSKVTEYINKSQDFAKPVLNHLRIIIHEACPELEEKIKWSFPHFNYKDSILCSMAAFKQHCSFGFWLSAQMKDPYGILEIGDDRESMGHLGKITSIKDLPKDKILIKYIHQAMKLIDQGAKLERKPSAKEEIEVPDYFLKAINKNKASKTNFEAFPYSHKKEYIQWIVEAKTDVTRQKRMDQAILWIAEGKGRNWKYEK